MNLRLTTTSRLLGLGLVLFLAACRTAGTAAAGRDEVGAGIHELTLHGARHDPRGEFRYTLLVPDDYRRERPAPLILALHYAGNITPFYGRNVLEILVAPALADLHAIIVAPDALEGRWDNDASEAAVLAILDEVGRSLSVDPRRTLVVGYSLGGRGTWFFAARHPERFRAAIPIAGRPVGEPAIPVCAIHSRADRVSPYQPTADRIAQLGKARLITVEGVSHFQVDGFVEPLRSAIPWIREVWAR
jgi:predicted peptidase